MGGRAAEERVGGVGVEGKVVAGGVEERWEELEELEERWEGQWEGVEEKGGAEGREEVGLERMRN